MSRYFVLLVVYLLGCTALTKPVAKSLPVLTPPEDGGPPWRELVSEHFVLRTDRGEGDAREALTTLEQSYVALRDIGFAGTRLAGKQVNVVHFARKQDYLQFAPPGAGGYFLPHMPNERRPEPTVVVWGDLDAAQRATFQHELAHMFVGASLGAMPTWLNEGLAQYYETLLLEDGYAYVGRPIMDKRAWRRAQWGNRDGILLVPIGQVPSVKQLTRMDLAAFHAQEGGPGFSTEQRRRRKVNYLGAFGLVHMLLQDGKYQPVFDAYMSYISQDLSSAYSAWDRVLSWIDVDEMEGDFREHLLAEETIVLRTPHTPVAVVPSSVRVMPPADVHVLWARLRPWTSTGAQLAEKDLGRARQMAPGSPEVTFQKGLFLLVTKGAEAAAPEIQRALAMRPRDPRYLAAALDVSLRLDKNAETKTEYRALVVRLAKESRDAFDLVRVAMHYVNTTQWARAHETALRATRIDPTCADCFEVLGIVLYVEQRYADALHVTEIASSLLHEQDIEGIKALGARCDELRKHARSAR